MCAHSGHSLVPMDNHGLSDPYCVIYENRSAGLAKTVGRFAGGCILSNTSRRTFDPMSTRRRHSLA